MPKLILTSVTGRIDELDVISGLSVMRAATQAGVPGIVGDCGGSMACATCHVLVDEAFLPILAAASETETAMLDFTAAPQQPNSRLSCQIVMSDALDGLRAQIADPQL